MCYAPTDAQWTQPSPAQRIHSTEIVNYTICNWYTAACSISRYTLTVLSLSLNGMRCRTLGVLTVVCAQLRLHICRGNVSGNINRETGVTVACVYETNTDGWLGRSLSKFTHFMYNVILSYYCNHNCYSIICWCVGYFVHSILLQKYGWE